MLMMDYEGNIGLPSGKDIEITVLLLAMLALNSWVLDILQP